MKSVLCFSFKSKITLTLSFLLSLFVLLQVSAQQTGDKRVTFGERPPIDLLSVPDDAFEPGMLKIKFKADYTAHLDDHPVALLENGEVLFNLAGVDELNREFGAKSAVQHYTSSAFSRSFSERHRAWGFHLWYMLEFDETADVKAMVERYRSLPEVEFAEPEYSCLKLNLPSRNIKNVC